MNKGTVLTVPLFRKFCRSWGRVIGAVVQLKIQP